MTCALACQEITGAKFDRKLRAGIHSGDSTFDNNDVYGDGTNNAAHLWHAMSRGFDECYEFMWRGAQFL